jgi:trehalose 6-phosphate synthase
MSVPLTDALMQRWFVRDLDIRSSAIAGNVQEQMATLAATRSEARILAFFNKMLQDERLYGVGLCVEPGAEMIATPNFPREVRCASLNTYVDPESGKQVLQTPRGPLHVAVRPIDADGVGNAQLVLVHDMSFAARRSEETRRYLFYFFVALSAAIALITVVIAQLSWRGWVQGLRALLRGEGILRPARVSTAPLEESVLLR